MRWELRAVLQNALMGIGPVRRRLSPKSGLGMNGAPERAAQQLDEYVRHAPIAGRDVLELGPGQTPHVLRLARERGARRCVGLDVKWRVDAPEGVELLVYDGRTMPFEAGSFDVIWSSDVLEHVRDPAAVVRESFRVLRPGGRMLAHVDLRDHYFLDREEKWFSCLRYSDRAWRWMTSNRTAHVNRLRASDWRRLLTEAGFRVVAFDGARSEVLRRLFAEGRLPSHRPLSADDAEVWRVDFAAEKPAA